jgi:hypothetical protein
MQLITIEATISGGIKIEHPFSLHEDPPSDKLLVMLPGRGYTCDHPLLYYLRMLATQEGYDVLSIVYSFQLSTQDPRTASLDGGQLAGEVMQAVRQALMMRDYKKLVLAGKSLGTPIAVKVAQSLPITDTSLILLTPIGTAVQEAGTRRTLAIIGTADPSYNEIQIKLDDERPNVRWRVLEGLNHSLESKTDWRGSMASLGEVMAACGSFL